MISIKHLPRYKDLAVLFYKYGRSDLVEEMGIEIPETAKTRAEAKELTKDLEQLGPTFIKLGQFLSTQVGFLPEAYQEALANLQDSVPPFSFEEVERIVSSELGVRLNQAFKEFNPIPLAAGSLSQVHEAVLPSGLVVAVKVQRPGIREQIVNDLDMFEELAEFLDKSQIIGNHFYWEEKVKSFRTALLNELDFRKEAQNLHVFSKNMAEFKDIIIPLPVDDYTNEKMLTMEYISSENIMKIHPLVRMDLNGKELAEELFQAYLKQFFIDGFVHIDPHPGNVYLTDTHKIALLDLGMVEHMSPQFQQELLKILIAVSDSKGEEVADLVIKLGHRDDDFQYYKFREEISDLVVEREHSTLEDAAIGALLIEITRVASQYNLRLPPKFNTLGKTLINLEKIVRKLAPHINPNVFIQDNVAALLRRKMTDKLSTSNMSAFLLEVTDLAQHLPARINTFLDGITKDEWKLKIQTVDETRLMNAFEKVANRIALGLVLAALIVGAALLMRVETDFRIFGYPGLAIVLFLAASVGSLLFILNILINDKRVK